MFSNLSDTFYPTPEWLARQMLRGLQLNGAYVLEPSAGKGDILDVIKEVGYGSANLYAIEIVPELRSILEGKGYPVIADDFLTYVPRLNFTHIIMNPPFDKAEEHVMYAWNMLYDGELVALVPVNALEGKTARERQLLHLIEDYGKREKVSRAFQSGAERTTRAEVEIIRLRKAANGINLDWEVHNDREDRTPDLDGESQELALQGFVVNLLSNHDAALANFQAYSQARQKLTVYCRPFMPRYGGKTALQVSDAADSPVARYNLFVRELTEQAWERILDHPGFQAVLTERARKTMAEFRQRQKRVDFNEANIRAMMEALIAKSDEFLMGAVLDAFNTMTEYHEYNRTYIEGWKTNKAWKVNRKVILPYYISSSWGSFIIEHGRIVSLDDIDRALCVVGGLAYTEILTVQEALRAAFQRDNKRPGRTESTFFDIRYFLKGTIHITFLDLDLWRRFNLTAAKGRNWLPPGDPGPQAPTPSRQEAQGGVNPETQDVGPGPMPVAQAALF